MLEKLFGFNREETTVRTEIFAGLTTFLTMVYILAVNPKDAKPILFTLLFLHKKVMLNVLLVTN